MMSDLEEIAAAAGIVIVDSDVLGCADDTDEDNENTSVVSLSDELSVTKQIEDWDAMFCNRYTMADPDYAETVEKAEILNRPPCVTDFNCWRQRDDSRNWNRDRRRYDGDRGRYNNRGNSHNRWNRPDGDSGDNWRRDNRQQHNPQNYGDYQHRGYDNQRTNDRHNWRNDNYQNRGTGYNQYRGNDRNHQGRRDSHYQNRGNTESQHSRDDSRSRQNVGYDSQRHRDRSRDDYRERSPS